MEGCQLAPGGPGFPLLTGGFARPTRAQSVGSHRCHGKACQATVWRAFLWPGRDAILWDRVFMRFFGHRFRQTPCFLGGFARNRPNY